MIVTVITYDPPRRRWPWFQGIGWRANFLGVVGLIGSYGNVVDVRFKRRRWLWMVLPVPCDRLTVSLEDPEAFLEALGKAGRPTGSQG